jgi:hypothetical protein
MIIVVYPVVVVLYPVVVVVFTLDFVDLEIMGGNKVQSGVGI